MLDRRVSDDGHDSDAKLQLGLSIGGLGLGEINYVSDEITLDATAAALFALPANVAVRSRCCALQVSSGLHCRNGRQDQGST